MSKSAQDQIFERMWERMGGGEVYKLKPPKSDKQNKFDDLKYRIESLTTIISAYKDTDVGTVLNPEELPNLGKKLASGSLTEVASLFQTPSFSMGLTVFWTATRALRHTPSLVSLGGTIARKNEREEFFAQPETWQALLANGDDFVKFLDVNKEFASRLLSKSTGLDPKIEEGKELPENMRARVVSEDLIPLVRNIIEAAKHDHVALGAAVSEVIMPLIKPERGKALDVSQLLGKLAELKVRVLSEVLSSPENLDHLSKISARSSVIAQEYAAQQKARIEAAKEARARIEELSTSDLTEIMASPAKALVEASRRIEDAKEVGRKVDPRDERIAQVAENLPMIKVLAASERVADAVAKKVEPSREDVALAATLNLGNQISQTLDNGIITREQIEKLEPFSKSLVSSLAGTENLSKILAIGAKITKQPPEIDLGQIIDTLKSTIIEKPDVKNALTDKKTLSVFKEIAEAAIKKPLPKVTKEKLDEVLGYASQGLTLLAENIDIVSGVAKFAAGELFKGNEHAKTREGIDKLAKETIPVLSSLVEDIKKSPELKTELLGIIDTVRDIKVANKSIEDLKKAIGFIKAEKSFIQDKLPALVKANHDAVAALLKPQIDKVPVLKGTSEKLTSMLEDPKILTQAVDIADNYVSGNKFKAAMQGIALFATSKKVRSFVGSVVFNAVKEKFKRKPEEVAVSVAGAVDPTTQVTTPTVELTKPSVEVAAPETVVAAPLAEKVITNAPILEAELVSPSPSIDTRDAAENPSALIESPRRSAGVGPRLEPEPIVDLIAPSGGLGSTVAPKATQAQTASEEVAAPAPAKPTTRLSAGVGPAEATGTDHRSKHPPRKRGESFAEAVRKEPKSTGHHKGAS